MLPSIDLLRVGNPQHRPRPSRNLCQTRDCSSWPANGGRGGPHPPGVQFGGAERAETEPVGEGQAERGESSGVEKITAAEAVAEADWAVGIETAGGCVRSVQAAAVLSLLTGWLDVDAVYDHFLEAGSLDAVLAWW